MAAESVSPALRECLLSGRHVGPPAPSARRGEARNAACGDIVVLWLELEGGLVKAAGFKAQGCPAAMAAAAGACEVLPGLAAGAGLPAALVAAFAERFGAPRPVHAHALAMVQAAAQAAAGAPGA